MGWFDEQLQLRKQKDNDTFEDSFIRIAGSIMGQKLTAALNDQRERTKDAVDDILNYYHVKSREVPEGKKSMDDMLEYLLRPSGIMVREVQLSKNWRKDASGAMLTVMKGTEQPIALIPYGMSGYRYRDPETGKWQRVTGKREELFDDMAYAFYKPFPMKKLKAGNIFLYMLENLDKGSVAGYLLFLLIATLVGMIVPQLNVRLFSDVLDSGSNRALLAIGTFIICASISNLLFGVVHELFLRRISVKLDQSVEAATMMRILSLPASFFKKYASGELSNRAQYINLLTTQVLDIGISTIMSFLFSLLYLIQIFSFAPSLAAPAIGVTVLTMVVTVTAALWQSRIFREQMTLASKGSGMSYALVSGIQKIRLSGAEKRAFARWGRLYASEAEYLYNPPIFLKVSSVINTAITLAGTIVIYYLAVRNHVSVAEYYSFNAAYAMVSASFASMGLVATELARIGPILNMAKPIMEAEPEVSEEKLVIEKLNGGIELSHVTFRYQEDMPPVLDNLSLKIRPGQYVAIVGTTGCGKSTLMRVMLGFEEPQRGAVYYDGKDLKHIDLKSLRSCIGTVLQEGKLFSGDIYSNIVISAPQLTLEDAWEAAELAGMGDDIRDMPMGMHTLLSEGQGGISGGQRQRLMIARAIAPKPKILMFDEATSALDNITQKMVSNSLDSLKCTRVVIAHRLSTIRRCDRIIVLDKGKIVEDGTYDQLMKQNGFFADLVARQQLDEGFIGKTTTF